MTAGVLLRPGMPALSDRDPLLALCADTIRLAIEDYLAGPGSGRGAGAAKRRRNHASAEAFLRQVGLLERVHQKHGAPAHLDRSCYQQLELWSDALE